MAPVRAAKPRAINLPYWLSTSKSYPADLNYCNWLFGRVKTKSKVEQRNDQRVELQQDAENSKPSNFV
jgi:hypothetical protein